MTIWEFRRKVRGVRWLCMNACPLGAAMGGFPLNPTPTWAQTDLGIPWGYALGVVAGFDDSAPPSMLPASEMFDRGERYGRRMRVVAQSLRGGAKGE